MERILGLHHITAIAGNAKLNLDFYTKVLGLRLVKKTVNFDDPGTYHFYYGDEVGTPGTSLTFFPRGNIVKGSIGSGMATGIGYSVNNDSLDFWKNRFTKHNIKFSDPIERMGETVLPFQDPDGLYLDLVVSSNADNRKGWSTNEVDDSVATKGFHSVTLTLRNIKPTATILTDIFGYKFEKQEGHRYRFVTDAVDSAAIIDLVEAPSMPPGHGAAGTNHHIAFRVKDDNVLMEYREVIARKGLNITPKIDRDYFFSLYFREPGGVLFELATDNPGFSKDEPVAELGTHLKLPKQYESSRDEIEKILPVLD